MLTVPMILVFGLCAIAAGFGQYIVALFTKASHPAAKAIGVVGTVLFGVASYLLAKALF